MKVLVGCERSGRIREAFRALGHDAWSCDLEASDIPGQHIRGDLFGPGGVWRIDGEFDLFIAHPPCTRLAVSGACRFKGRETEQSEAIRFFMACINAPVPRMAVENPVGIMSTLYRKPDQIIQPWMYGHPESKATCLWLRGLPMLRATDVLTATRWRTTPGGKRVPQWDNQTASGQNKLGPSPDRGEIRARTYQGVAEAMAKQWGSL